MAKIRGTLIKIADPKKGVTREEYEAICTALGIEPKSRNANEQEVGEEGHERMNAMFAIHPYKHRGMWVFDDESAAGPGAVRKRSRRDTSSEWWRAFRVRKTGSR